MDSQSLLFGLAAHVSQLMYLHFVNKSMTSSCLPGVSAFGSCPSAFISSMDIMGVRATNNENSSVQKICNLHAYEKNAILCEKGGLNNLNSFNRGSKDEH